MNNMLKSVISAATLSLCLLTPAHAEEQRYISIRNTDTVWVPGNICVYRFRLDNGGSGEGFGPLTLSLRLKDKQGNTLAVGEMGVEPFGDQFDRLEEFAESVQGEKMRLKRNNDLLNGDERVERQNAERRRAVD